MSKREKKSNRPAETTAAQRRREGVTRTVKRNARGNVQLSQGRFVTREDKSLSKLDQI